MKKQNIKRMELRVDTDLYDKVLYFADKQDVSRNQFMEDALKNYIHFIVSDYDLPTAEIARLNQLCDSQQSVVEAVTQLTKSLNDGLNGLNYTLSGNDYLGGDDNDAK